MTLKNLKPQPLLEPPSERDWWAVRESDVKLITKAISEWKESKPKNPRDKPPPRHGVILTGLYADMKRLGFPQEIPSNHYQAMSESIWESQHDDIQKLRLTNEYPDLISLDAGIRFNAEAAKKTLLEFLESHRDGSLMGLRIASFHLGLKRSGWPQEITPKDEKTIREELETTRKLHPDQVPHALAEMKELGLTVDVGKKDLALLEKQIRGYRDRGWGVDLSQALVIAQTLIPKEETKDAAAKLPPVKRYGGGGG